MRPLERLPMKRTGSMASRVPPAVMRTVWPVRSAVRGAGVFDSFEGCGDDGGDLGEAAGAGHSAGEVAAAGFDDVDSAVAEDGEVGLGGGVVPHVDVHRGGDDDGGGGGEVEGGEEVVGDAVGEFGEGVGGGGGYDQGRVDWASAMCSMVPSSGSGLRRRRRTCW